MSTERAGCGLWTLKYLGDARQFASGVSFSIGVNYLKRLFFTFIL